MRNFGIILGVVAIAATPSFAHEGPRIWIGNVAGKVTTFTSDNDLDPTSYSPSQLFATELQSFFGIYTTEFPGYEVRQDGGNVAAETTFTFNITGPALYFDDASDTYLTTQAVFGPPQPGPVPQMAVSLGSEIRATGAGAGAGFPFFTFHGIGDHSHLSYTLLGDGVTASDGPAGVYAISLNLTSATLTTSETFFLLLGKDVVIDDPLFQSAIAVAQATLVSPVIRGDMDCNGTLDTSDVSGFILAEANPAAYTASHPACDISRADMNADGVVNAGDIQLFVNSLFD